MDAYAAQAARKSDLQRTELAKEKTGVFTGSWAVNPVNGARLPIWVADYVLGSYGSGAIMAVPAHDARDFAFATSFSLPVVQVLAPADGSEVDLPFAGAFALWIAYQWCLLSVWCVMTACMTRATPAMLGVSAQHLLGVSAQHILGVSAMSPTRCRRDGQQQQRRIDHRWSGRCRGL